ncbi:MAG TPA: hypothetical protein VNZ86_12165, partial [Bacteroidia bacterium]|nr:hypothetical protein [Bacteroidia bacterium]
MNRFRIYLFTLFLPLCVHAQQNSRDWNSDCIPKPDMLDGQKVYRLASKLAAYPGGDAAMMDFIGKNFKHIKGKNPGKKSLTITIV